MKRWLLFSACAAFIGMVPGNASAQTIPMCTSGSLASYFGTTCDMNNGSILRFVFGSSSSFTNTVGSIDPSQIEVTPEFGTDPSGLGGGFFFCESASPCQYGEGQEDPGFSGGSTGLNFGFQYAMIMTTDPFISNADIGGDPPTGSVIISEDFCADPHNVGQLEVFNVCTNGSYPTGQPFVANFGGPNDPVFDSFAITPAATLEGLVSLNFDIGPNSTLGALEANYDVVTTLTPEPATCGLMLCSLTLIGIRRFRRRVS